NYESIRTNHKPSGSPQSQSITPLPSTTYLPFKNINHRPPYPFPWGSMVVCGKRNTPQLMGCKMLEAGFY
ncbi:MAG: hypothetical protein KAI94_11210, partial [Anaerolineales bacterium]|nr:hypothetical protein [Anaerolineales bacterium]